MRYRLRQPSLPCSTPALLLLLVGLLVVGGGCYRRPRAENGPGGAARRGDIAAALDPNRAYHQMGLVTGGEPLPFVGGISFLAGPTPDTTLVLVTLSLPARALTFVREGDRYRATYEVRLDLRQGSNTVRHIESPQLVRVPSFRETTRGDESVIFQQLLSVPPGQYNLAFAVRDGGSARTVTEETLVIVPRVAGPALSTPIAVYDATPRMNLDSLPELVAAPRATAAFGRDSMINVYLEGYASPTPGAAADAAMRLSVSFAVRGEGGSALWSDTASLPRRGALWSGVVRVPVARLGVGIATFAAWRPGTTGADTVRTPLFVSFGDELPVASFDEMLNYLRYFASPERLAALRAAPPEARAAAWAAFLRDTDPVPSTTQHEGIRDYFTRVQTASQRFRDEGQQGWLTDRGRVFISLGEPDQLYEQGGQMGDVNTRGRAQIWEYREHRLQLIFIDQTGFSRWRLTAQSSADFEAVTRRLQTER